MTDLKSIWKRHYEGAPATLAAMRTVSGVASVFNANIDAVLRVTPKKFETLMRDEGATEEIFEPGPKRIAARHDLLRGFLECFRDGIAQEWLVMNRETFDWMQTAIGHERLQMGGQGGIIANVMAVCGIPRVAVHCASAPAQQTMLFLDEPNLFAAATDGSWTPAASLDRKNDAPLVHWILEFDGDAEIRVGDRSVRAPKSNRFIATYDPLNFALHIDAGFDHAMSTHHPDGFEFILLSGYQMLSEHLGDLESGAGIRRIEDSWDVVARWKEQHPRAIVHFEFASTQDEAVRRALCEKLIPKCDSLGVNEQELISILEVLGETDLAREARALDSVSLYRGLETVFRRLRIPRIQLHMFGLYITILDPAAASRGAAFAPESNLRGMTFAATLAAAKAGTGTLENHATLLWAHGREVSDRSLQELTALDEHLAARLGAGMAARGIVEVEGMTVIATPTILIDKPVTLVGMGDTISSLSLVGAR